MNVESYSYVAITALIGMGVVFFFLIALSLLMYGIRFLFDDRSQKKTTKRDLSSPTGRSQESGDPVAAADVIDTNGLPRWVIAATLAYLVAEEREYAPEANGWVQRHTDRWGTRRYNNEA